MFRIVIGGLWGVTLISTLLVRAAIGEEVKIAGMLTKIEGQLLTVKTESGNEQMKIAPATKVIMNGKPMESRDLKVGQKVKGDCEKRGSEVVCVTLEVMGSP